MHYKSEFIPTRFARNDEMQVESSGLHSNHVLLGFYSQNGRDYSTHGMSSEAAIMLAVALQEAVRAQGGVVLDAE